MHPTTWLFRTSVGSCCVDGAHWERTSNSLSGHRRCVAVSTHRRALSQSTHPFVPPNVPSGHVKHRLSLMPPLASVLVHVTLHVAPIATVSSQTAQRVSLGVTRSAVCENEKNDPCMLLARQTRRATPVRRGFERRVAPLSNDDDSPARPRLWRRAMSSRRQRQTPRSPQRRQTPPHSAPSSAPPRSGQTARCSAASPSRRP